LQAAKYLVVEVNDGFPKNNFETIWDGWDADGNKTGDWAQFSQVTTTGGELNPGFGTRDGNTLKLEMSKIIKDYSLFRSSKTVAITLLIQHWGNGGPAACIKSAKLLVSDEPVPYVGITKVELKSNSFYSNGALKLELTVTPQEATNQIVTWSIKSFQSQNDDGVNVGDLLAIDPDDYSTSKAALDEKIGFKRLEEVIDDTVWPILKGPGKTVRDTLAGVKGEAGIVTVVASIKEGKQNDAGTLVDVVEEFAITIKNAFPFTITVGGEEQEVEDYGAFHNTGGGATYHDIKRTADNDGLHLTFKGNGYGNHVYWFRVDFGEDTFGDYEGVKFTFKGIGPNGNEKDPPAQSDHSFKDDMRVKVMKEVPDETYGPGIFVAWTPGYEDASEGLDFDAKFGWNYSKTLSAPSQTTNIGEPKDGPKGDLSGYVGENVLYFWIYPQCTGVEFEIYNIDFYKKK